MILPPLLFTSFAKVRTLSSLVKLAHTIFALPFAASAVLLALGRPHVPLAFARAAAMLVCIVCARTAAMSFNRYLDRDIDAANPRTQDREIPKGVVRPQAALALSVTMGAAFVAAAFTLGPTPFRLAPLVLLVLLGYSYTKRFTWASHLVLGLSLSLAPGGAWIAMGAEPSWGIVALMLGVLTWTAGFDILYSLQDEHFDRSRGLFSVPARFGSRRSLLLSRALHVLATCAFAGCGMALDRGPAFFVGVALVALLLTYEHALLLGGNLAKLDRAFFDVNGYVSCGFFLLTAVDSWMLSH